jgi:hypothetical protein
MVFNKGAVWSSKKELCGIDERSCVVSNKRAVWCPTKDQDDHFNVVRLQSSDRGKARNDVKRQVIERCDILILKGVGGDLMAGRDLRSDVCQTLLLLLLLLVHYVRSIDENNGTRYTYQGVTRRKVFFEELTQVPFRIRY